MLVNCASMQADWVSSHDAFSRISLRSLSIAVVLKSYLLTQLKALSRDNEYTQLILRNCYNHFLLIRRGWSLTLSNYRDYLSVRITPD